MKWSAMMGGLGVGLVLATPGVLAIPVEWNGHYYDYIPALGIEWPNAQAAAAASSHLGLPGHLATLTSQEENAFVASLVDGVVSYPGDPNVEDVLAAWVGGFQDPVDEPDPAKGWTWVNGEGSIPIVNAVTPFGNWFGGEPNDWLGPQTENYLAVWGSAGYGNTIGSWNDEGGLWDISGYLVEFEAVSNVPDGGSTSGLLVFGLVAFGTWRRRIRARTC